MKKIIQKGIPITVADEMFTENQLSRHPFNSLITTKIFLLMTRFPSSSSPVLCTSALALKNASSAFLD
jgi:hypothetical protein